MYNGKRILGMIPARGGSKGLPGKNVRPLLGKPLIAWTIEQAKASVCLDETIVSTDDPEIAQVAEQFEMPVPFTRPEKLAADQALIIDTILYTLDWYEQQGKIFDYFALMEPTSPLRGEGDIDRGLSSLIDNQENADSLMYLGRVVLQNPYMAKKIDEKGLIRPFFESFRAEGRRQELPKAYIPYGVLYASKVSALREYGTFYQPRTMPLVTQRWQNYEVDDIYDFLCVEAVMKQVIAERKTEHKP